MADPLVSEVITDAQSHLGDPGGEVYDFAMLAPYYGVAYRDVINLMLQWNIPFVDKTGYVVLPAYTSQISPAQCGILDFGEPQKLFERGSIQTVAISSVSNTTPIVVTTATDHGLTSNARVDLYNVANTTGVVGSWFITVTASNAFSLNGSVAGGAATTGTVAWSSEKWVLMYEQSDLLDAPVMGESLVWWRWDEDVLKFVGSTEVRELRIEYTASGNPPITGNVGIDNARDFLSYRTAALAADTRDEDRAGRYNFMACGRGLEPDGRGGLLRTLMVPMIKQKQRIANRRQPYRQRRHNIIMRPWI